MFYTILTACLSKLNTEFDVHTAANSSLSKIYKVWQDGENMIKEENKKGKKEKRKKKKEVRLIVLSDA